MRSKTTKYQKYGIPVFFLITGILLCIRSQYGYSFNDEPFIISLAQQLSYGSSLIIDEWNAAQNFGVILLPLFRLYLAVFQSTEGILLFFRIVYSVLWALVCITVYLVIRKKYSGAILVYLYLLLFSPLDQMTMSYTSVSLMCCLLIGCLFLYHFEIKAMRFSAFVFSFTALTLIAVISLPHLAFAYIGFFLISWILFFVRRTDNSRFLLRVALCSCVICVVVAAIYLYRFIFNKHTLEAVLQNVSNMFWGTTYENTSIAGMVTAYADSLLSDYLPYCVLIAVIILGSQLPFVRMHPNRKLVFFFVAAIAGCVKCIELVILRHESVFNQQMLPIVFLGITAFFMLDNRKMFLPLIKTFTLWGIAYSFFFFLASDTGIQAISMCLSVSGVASIVFIAELFSQYRQYFADLCKSSTSRRFTNIISRGVSLFFALVFTCQLSTQLFLKMERHYWDLPVYIMDATIGSGAAKGLKTVGFRKVAYEESLQSLLELLNNVDYSQAENIKFMSLIGNPVQYLDAQLPMGCFSSWTFMDDDDQLVQKLNLYYSINPQNIPTVIYFHSDDEKIHQLEIDTSGYVLFTEGDFHILISPEYITPNVRS